MRFLLWIALFSSVAVLSACQSGGMAAADVAKPEHKPEALAPPRKEALLPPAPKAVYGPFPEYGPFRAIYGPFAEYELAPGYKALMPFTAPIAPGRAKPGPLPRPAAKPKAARIQTAGPNRAASASRKVIESAYTALAVQKAQAKMIELFRKLDYAPLLTTDTPSLRQWADEGGGCAIAFTHDKKLSGGSVLSEDVAFPVTEAVPVKCANLQYAYSAALKDRSLRDIEKISDGKPAAMRYVSDKRDKAKRSLVKMVLAKPGQALKIMTADASSS